MSISLSYILLDRQNDSVQAVTIRIFGSIRVAIRYYSGLQIPYSPQLAPRPAP